MLSPVRPEYMEMRRMSPAPRKIPKALEYVGAAATAVAANARSKPRRVNPGEFFVVMLSVRPVFHPTLHYPQAAQHTIPRVRHRL